MPHFIWLLLWTLAVAVRRASPTGSPRSCAAARRARCTAFSRRTSNTSTQFYAYLHLAAEPYPTFDGQDGYPIDLLDRAARAPEPPERRLSRHPAAARRAARRRLVGDPSSASAPVAASFTSQPRAAARRRAARLVRDHGARTDAARPARRVPPTRCPTARSSGRYALLLTDRYPDSDPLAPCRACPCASDPIAMRVDDDLRRSRLTVFFRLLLSLPHLVWL